MSYSTLPIVPATRPLHRLPALLLILLALFSLTSSAFAATLTVTNTSDSGSGSLRGVIAAAGSGDTIVFSTSAFPIGSGTAIALTSGRLLIAQNLTIQGPGAGSVTISNSSDGVFNVSGTSSSMISVSISGLTIAHGTGTSPTSNGNGGGIYSVHAALTVTGCTFSQNNANGGGGGLSINSGSLTLTNCTLSGNSAGVGGGINSNGGTLTLTNCTLTGNTGGVEGGGLSSNGSATVANCTFSGNQANSGNGGGIFNAGGSTLLLTNCTFVGNAANSSSSQTGMGGGIFNAGSATVQSSIINGNSATYGGPDVSGSFGSGGSNLIGDPNGAAYGFTGAHDLIAVNPHLDPNGLGSNGGPTQTVAVLAGSPAIGGDYNNATATDQRGIARTSVRHTIGAFEYNNYHTHLLWNNVDGRVMLWSIAADGTFTLHGFGPYTDNAPGNVWHATALATGPDGNSHILWNNTDGRVMLWTVDDAGNFTLAGYGPYTDNSVGTNPAVNKWSATAVSVGPDNIVHLLWNNTDHRVMLWNVDSSFNFTLAGYGPYTDTSVSSDPGNLWSATALATGPDNVSRIVWNNVDGRVMLWKVPSNFSFTLAGYGPYTDNAPQNKWSAVAVSVGPDNLTHLVWNNTDRRAMFWNVDASFNFSLAGYGPYTDNAPANLWNVTAVATGADNLSHLLWNNTDYRVMLWGVDNAFDFTVAGYGPYTDNSVNSNPGNFWSAVAVSAGP